MSAQKNKNAEPDSTLDRMVDPASLALLTGQVRNLLAFHAQLGLSGYPATPELRNILLRAPSRPPSRPAPPRRENGGQRAGSVQPVQPNRQQSRGLPDAVQGGQSNEVPSEKLTGKAIGEAAASQLQAITQELTDCQRCLADAGPPASPASTMSPPRPLPGWGSPTPRLLVLGDCYIGDTPQRPNMPMPREGMIWGREEDELFWKMMAAIGLDQKTVYVTNTFKCPQKNPVPPGAEREHPCFVFLEKEIGAIQPQLICTMGNTATRALLRNKAPLVRLRLRSRFHTYNYPVGGQAKVMPTFHPRFLLQYPEMKHATWEDLQALQHLLPALQE